MGKAQSSLLTVEPFAVLKSQLWHRSTAVQAVCPYCTLYSVHGQAAGSPVEGGFNSQRSGIQHYFAHQALINLCIGLTEA